MGSMTTVPAARPMTRADLDAIPGAGCRHELIDGSLFVTRPDSAMTRAERESWPARGRRVELADGVLVARTVHHTLREVVTPPLLTVEVLSPSTRIYDLTMKRSVYEEAGVASYWVIDPLEPSLIAWDLVDGSYVEVGHVRGDEAWTSTLPFPVTITPARLVADR